MNADRRIRTAVLGLGRIGWPTHFERINRDERYQLVAVADAVPANRDRAVNVANCTAFNDAGQLLAELDNLDIEVVVNALPSQHHVALGRAVLSAGRHAVIEKPLAATAAAALELTQSAQAACRHLFVHHDYRFRAYARHAQQVIQSGRLGRIFQVTANIVPGWSRRNDWQTLHSLNGGLLRNHGTHWIDLALHLLNEPATDIWGDVKLVSDAGDAEDHCKIVLRLRDGCVVDILASTSCQAAFPKLVICGTRGTLVSDCAKTTTITAFDPAACQPLAVDMTPRKDYQGVPLPMVEETVELENLAPGGDFYDNVYDVLRGNAAPVVKLAQVVEVHRIIDTILGKGTTDWREPSLKPPAATA